jgi:hypothetical protein
MASMIAAVRMSLIYPLYTSDVRDCLAENNYNVEATIKSIMGTLDSSQGADMSDSETIASDGNARDINAELSTEASSGDLLDNADTRAEVLAPKSRVTFLTIPREMRDLIYGHLLISNRAVKVRQPGFSVGVKSSPTFPIASLARVCKQVAEECLPIFYSQNVFRLDLNILTAVDWLKTLPTAIIKGRMKSITLAKTIMTGFVRHEYGLYDSARLRNELVKKLIYELDIDTINLEVPDETPPSSTATNPFNTLMHYHPSREYSWALTREFCDTLLSGGGDELRLCYPIALAETSPEKLYKLNAVSKLLYMDDDFEISAAVKRIDTAREHGKRPEFKSKADVENYVRGRRAKRKFALYAEGARRFEKGTAIVISRPMRLGREGDDGAAEALGLGRRQRRDLGREYFSI